MDKPSDDQKRRQDLDDLNNEMAGRDVGRIRRFMPERDPETLESKKREKEARETALMQLLRDPQYAAAYQGAWDAVDRAQAALDAALLDNAEQAEHLEEQIAEYERRAARLEDGTLVFRSADGSMRGADGHRLRSDAVPASLIIPLDAPSYEDYSAAQDALNHAHRRGSELARIQTDVIDPATDRLTDQDNPPSLEELDRITRSMESAEVAISSGQLDARLTADSPLAAVESDQILDLNELTAPSSTNPAP